MRVLLPPGATTLRQALDAAVGRTGLSWFESKSGAFIGITDLPILVPAPPEAQPLVVGHGDAVWRIVRPARGRAVVLAEWKGQRAIAYMAAAWQAGDYLLIDAQSQKVILGPEGENWYLDSFLVDQARRRIATADTREFESGSDCTDATASHPTQTALAAMLNAPDALQQLQRTAVVAPVPPVEDAPKVNF